MTILLVRHGESTGNKLNVYQGITADYDLTENGIRQAKRIAQFCRKENTIPEIILYSPLLRAKRTAEIVYDLLEINKSKLIEVESLKEVDLGIIEGMDKKIAKQKFYKQFNELKSSNYDFSLMGGESKEEVNKRARYVINYCESLKEKTVMLVTHGSFIRDITEIMLGENNKISKVFNGQVLILKNIRKGNYKIKNYEGI